MREAVAGPHPQLPPAGHLGKLLPIWLGLSAGGVLFVLGWLFSILNTFCGRCAGTPWPLCGPGAHMRRRPPGEDRKRRTRLHGGGNTGPAARDGPAEVSKIFLFCLGRIGEAPGAARLTQGPVRGPASTARPPVSRKGGKQQHIFC